MLDREDAHHPFLGSLKPEIKRTAQTAGAFLGKPPGSPALPAPAVHWEPAWNGPAWNPPRLEPAPPCTQTSRGGVGAFYFSFLFQLHTSLWNRRATEIFQGSLHLRSQETKTSERRWKTQRRQKARRTPARAPWARNRRRSRHTAPLKKEQMFF